MVRLQEQFETLYLAAVNLAVAVRADALLVLLEGRVSWDRLKELAGPQKILVAADVLESLAGAAEAGIPAVVVNVPGSAVYERVAQALLECVADDFLSAGAKVVALYSGFEDETIDSLGVINLSDHFGRLTGRDLRQLETSVPLNTLKMLLDLAVEIGREGREGKPVGTLFVVGDARKVLAHSHPVGFDPVKGYSRKDRNLNDPRVREGVKEFAWMDGAIIVATDGTVEAAARYLDASASEVTLSKGLGSRHWAAAAITRVTNAVAIAVSESTGTVRIFHNGEVVLRVEPFRRAMKWKEFEHMPPPSSE